MTSTLKTRCWVCNKDITGLMSIEKFGVPSVQRETYYDPEHCADYLQITRDAWKALAKARASRRGVREAVGRLRRLGEIP